MIRQRRPARYPAAPGASGNDTDALQTDVMRFLSILGLCLMAVFALVQSIPLQETSRPRQKPEAKILQREIRLQQERVQALKDELRQLAEQITAANARHSDAQQAATAAEAQLARVIDQARETHNRREQLTAELQDMEQQLRQGQRELDEMRQAAVDQTHSLQTLQQRLQQARQQLDNVEQRLQALHEETLPEPVQTVKEPPPASLQTVKEPPAPPEPDRQKQGFTLRFASVGALDRLVAAGTVRLYGMADRQAWRLSLTGGSPTFVHTEFPKWFHEMAPATVPPDYVRSLVQSVEAPAGSQIVWGVQLPTVTKQDISSLTRGRPGGTLVIRADGQVILEPE